MKVRWNILLTLGSHRKCLLILSMKPPTNNNNDRPASNTLQSISTDSRVYLRRLPGLELRHIATLGNYRFVYDDWRPWLMFRLSDFYRCINFPLNSLKFSMKVVMVFLVFAKKFSSIYYKKIRFLSLSVGFPPNRTRNLIERWSGETPSQFSDQEKSVYESIFSSKNSSSPMNNVRLNRPSLVYASCVIPSPMISSRIANKTFKITSCVESIVYPKAKVYWWKSPQWLAITFSRTISLAISRSSIEEID